MRFGRTRKKGLHALPRLGIVEELPGEFQFVGIAAAAGLTGGGDASLAGGKRRGRKISDAACRVVGALRQLDTRRRPMHHAERGRGGAVENFRAENQPAGERRAAQPGETLGPAGAGDQAEAGFRQADFRFIGRDPQIAGERQFEAAAQRRAADLGQRNLGSFSMRA